MDTDNNDDADDDRDDAGDDSDDADDDSDDDDDDDGDIIMFAQPQGRDPAHFPTKAELRAFLKKSHLKYNFKNPVTSLGAVRKSDAANPAVDVKKFVRSGKIDGLRQIGNKMHIAVDDISHLEIHDRTRISIILTAN